MANLATFFVSGWGKEEAKRKSKHKKHGHFSHVFCAWNNRETREGPRHEKCSLFSCLGEEGGEESPNMKNTAISAVFFVLETVEEPERVLDTKNVAKFGHIFHVWVVANLITHICEQKQY